MTTLGPLFFLSLTPVDTVINREVVSVDVDEHALAVTKRRVLDALHEAGFAITEVHDGKSIEERLRLKVANGYETAFYIMDVDTVLRKHRQWLQLLNRVKIRYGGSRSPHAPQGCMSDRVRPTLTRGNGRGGGARARSRESGGM